MNDNETVREVCGEQLELPSTERNRDWQVACLMFRDELQRLKREMAAKDAEIARLKESSCEYALPNHGCTAEDKHFHKTIELERKVALMERALKPVMSIDVPSVVRLPSVGEPKIIRDWCYAQNAVREAQRIMKEGDVK